MHYSGMYEAASGGDEKQVGNAFDRREKPKTIENKRALKSARGKLCIELSHALAWEERNNMLAGYARICARIERYAR